MYAEIKNWIEYISSFDPSLVFKRRQKKDVEFLTGFITFGIESIFPTHQPQVEKFAVDESNVGIKTEQRKEIRVVVDVYNPNGHEILELLSESSYDINVLTIFGEDSFLRTESITDLAELVDTEYPDWYQGIYVFASSKPHTRNIPRVRGIQITGEIGGSQQEILIGDIES